jgi:3-dehydroquinate dehydratase
VRELDRRLESFQFALGKVDANLTRSVAELRRELNDKVTKDQVRKIVEQALADLENRVKELEIRVDRLDVRVKAIEEAFGFLPTVPPSPLLRTTAAEGNAEAHPLTVEWAKLLSRMETSRVNIELLLADRTDENDEVKAARAADAKLLAEISPLMPSLTAC